MSKPNTVGTPKFQLKVPYTRDTEDSALENGSWYIIITSQARHFYYNKSLQKSYWQLNEVKSAGEFSEPEWKRFLESIQYEEVALLVGKANGVKGLESDKETKKEEVKVHQETQEEEKEEEEEGVVHEQSSESEEEEEIDVEARDEFISQLLKEEGFIKEQVEEEKPEKSALVSGYSSSEEEDGDEEEVEEEQKEDKEELEHLEEDEEDGNVNLGLDLSLSEDEIDSTSKSEFLQLLNSLGDKISAFDTWPMIEEELIQGLVKHPEFYAISSTEEREVIFNEWADNQKEEENTDHEIVDEFPSPSPTLQLFHILQEYKSEIKKLYYPEFFNMHQEELKNIDLSRNEKETKYREFKVMITDFSDHERRAKKAKNYDPKVNLKKAALSEFLQKKKFKFSAEKIVIPEGTSFQKWLFLIEKHEIDSDISEDSMNFIVGDDKRLQCYEEYVQ